LTTLLATRFRILLGYAACLMLLCLIGGVCYACPVGLTRAAEERQLQEARDLVWWARLTILAATTCAFVMAGLAWLALRRDFRLRHEADLALTRSEPLFRSFFESNLVMAGVVETLDDDVVLLSLNAAAASALGGRPEELSGRKASEFCPQEEIRLWLEKYREATRAGGAIRFEYGPAGRGRPRRVAASVCAILPTPGTAGRPRFAYIAEDVTERRNAEAALRKSEERLRLALESTRDGLWDYDVPADACFFSPRWLAMFDPDPSVTGSQIGGATGPLSSWEMRVHPDDRAAFRERLEGHMAGKTVIFEHEQRVVTSAGRCRRILSRGRVVARDGDGKATRVVGTSVDVTERCAADERFRVLFERSTNAHILFDDSGVIDCNPATLAMLRLTDKSQLVGRHPAAMSPERQPDGGNSVEKGAEADRVAREKGVHRFEWVHRRADGEEFPVEVTLSPVSINGNPGMLADWVDLTERKRAEEAMRASEARYRFLAESVPQLIWSCDAAGRAVDFNRRWYEYSGMSLQESKGTGWMEALHPDDRAPTLARWREVIAGGGPYRVEYRLRRASDGAYRWHLSVGRPIRDVAGRISRWFGATTDVHDQKVAEEELRRAKEAAESANRAKSEFLANVSHEIRTPMNGILGMTELALGEETLPHQRDRLRIVHDSATALLCIINDLLDFSKIEAGKMELDLVPFDLQRELGSTVRSLAERAHRKGLELVCRVSPELPTEVVGDPDRLRQVLVNLLGNAVKFTERGGIEVSVELSGRGPDEVCVAFAVRDSGVGISEDKLESIFLPFEQADTSTTRRYGGTGLGLTIASRLVGMMGGQIGVESRPGAGATFRFTARFRALASASAPFCVRRLEELEVLVVEDSVFFRAVLVEMLMTWQMRPTLACGPPEALAALSQASREGRTFAVAVVDEDLPGEDGRCLAARLHSECGFAGPVLLLRRAGVRREGSPAGPYVTATLEKPFTPSELQAALAQVLRLSHTGATRSPAAVDTPSAGALRVLLAEDNPINQKVTVGVLRRLGHTFRVAASGREALAALEEESFDAVLMDVQMPEMDGFTATAILRERESRTGRHLPVIAMTARAMKGDEEECLRAGMDAYLSKPFAPADLARILARLVSGTAAPAIAAPVSPSATAGSPIEDVAAVMEAVEGDGELLRELVGLFHEGGPPMRDELRASLAAGDADRLGRAAHKLGGAVSMFHARKTLHAVRRLEEMARMGNLHEAPAALADLECALAALHPALDALVEKALRGEVWA
jgi:PAS domain S-box-containing protein